MVACVCLIAPASTFPADVPSNPTETLNAALVSAITAGNVDSVRLLLEAGASPNGVDPILNQSPLCVSVVQNGPNAIRIVSLLLQHGSDPNIRCALGLTPLAWAAQSGKPALVQELIKGGAQTDAIDITGRTVGQISRAEGHSTMAAALGQVDAQPTCRMSPAPMRPVLAQPLPTLEMPRLHGGNITALALSSNGELLATGGMDGTAAIWDLRTQRKIREIASHRGSVDAIDIDEQGQTFATASVDEGTIRTWSLLTGQLQREIAHLTPPRWLRTAVKATGTRAIAVATPRLIAAWDWATCAPLSTLTLANDVTNLAMSRTADLAAIAEQSGNVILWDLVRNERTAFRGPGTRVTALAFAPDAHRLALTATADENARNRARSNQLELWELSPVPRLIAQQTLQPGRGFQAISFSRDGRALLLARDEYVAVLQVEGLAVTNDGGAPIDAESVAAIPTTPCYVVGGLGGIITVPQQRASSGCGPRLQAFALGPAEPFFLSGRRQLLVRNGNALRTWDLSTSLTREIAIPSDQKITAVDVDPSGDTVYLGDERGTLSGVDISTRRLQQSKPLDTCAIGALRAVQGVVLAASGAAYPGTAGDCAQPKVQFLSSRDFSPARNPVSMPADSGGVGRLEADNTATHIVILPALGAFNLWNSVAGKLQELPPEEGALTLDSAAAQVLSDGRIAVALSGSGENSGVALADPSGLRPTALLRAPHRGYLSDVVVLPDQIHLLGGGQPGELLRWNIQSGALELVAPDTSGIHRIALRSEVPQSIATGLDDGTVSIWEASGAHRLVQLFAYAPGNSSRWLVVTPDGHYDSNSPGDLPGVSWVLPADPLTALPVESFMKEYYEPGLLGKVLRGEKLSEVRRLELINRVQPEVKIVDIEPEEDRRLVRVTVEVREGRREVGVGQNRKWVSTRQVQDLRLFRDGQLVGYEPKESGAIALTEGQSRIVIEHIKVPTGGRKSVEFSAYAFNEDWVKSLTDRRTYEIPRGLPERKARAYVVSIGMDEYENRAWHLNYAANDATEMQRLVGDALERSGRYEKVVRVGLISREVGNRRVSKAQIKAVLDLLAGHPVAPQIQENLPQATELRTANPEDLLLITYSGHGMAGSHGEFYLFPYDTGTGATVPAALLSSEELSQWLKDVDAGDLTLIIDACESATSVQGEGFRPGPMGSRGLGQLAYDKGMRVLAASQPQEAALESPQLRHGILSYALLTEGLEEGRADYEPKDNQITLVKWLNWGVLRVPQLYEALTHHRFVANRGFTYAKNHPITLAPHLQQPQLFDFANDRADIVLSRHGEP